MSFQVILLLIGAFLTFVVAPIVIIWSVVDHFRHRASDRPGSGGGISHAVGSAMLELDRLLARPSVEHQIETESPVVEPDEDDGE
jgi:hypothetical protein